MQTAIESATHIDPDRLQRLLGSAVVDFGATMHAALVRIGEKLGLYRALAESGPLTSAELAARTETVERYVREWLAAQAAGGYVEYDAATGRFWLSPEQALVLADESGPAYLPAAFQIALAATRALPRVLKAFRNGGGVGWHEQDHELFHGTERFFRPSYATHLVQEWIPALDGVEARLRAGIHIADIGCGFGASTILIARSYPRSTFAGFDSHAGSIEVARRRAEAAGVADRVRFEVASATTFDGGPYDFVTAFDCLHDMGDPAGAARHVRSRMRPNGSWMIVEPNAGDRLEDNLHAVGRVFYSVSTLVCTPCSLDQEVGRALGAQAGEGRIREVVQEGGFTRFQRATGTPFNLVFEARP